jgi:hypothetical protein
MSSQLEFYAAIIWPRDSDRPGLRVSIRAESLDDAKKQLEAEHGEGTVLDLHNEEEAAKPR